MPSVNNVYCPFQTLHCFSSFEIKLSSAVCFKELSRIVVSNVLTLLVACTSFSLPEIR